jgi:hypothetical protein
LSALLFIWKAGEGPIEAGEQPSSLFIDEAVYTRNRAFRLPYSCKFGKTARLLPTSRYKCKNLVSVMIPSLATIVYGRYKVRNGGCRSPHKAK